MSCIVGILEERTAGVPDAVVGPTGAFACPRVDGASARRSPVARGVVRPPDLASLSGIRLPLAAAVDAHNLDLLTGDR
jgi:hypothetical protein